MPEVIDESLQNRFFDVCDGFCKSSDAEGGSLDIKSRQSFIKKLYSYLASIDSSDSQYGFTMNYIYGMIVRSDVLLSDMMRYFSDKAMTAESIGKFIDDYSYDSSTIRAGILKKIETELLKPGDGIETSVGDIISSDSLFKFELPEYGGLYIAPTIRYSFVSSDSYFMSEFDAISDFSKTEKAFIDANPGCNSLASGFAELDSLSFDAFGNSSSAPKLAMMWRLGDSAHYALLNWLKRMDLKNAGTDVESICKNRLSASEYDIVFGDIAERMYKAHASITQVYETRNSKFSVTESLGKALIDYDSSSIDHDSFMPCAFLCLIAEKNSANLSAAQKTKLSAIESSLSSYREAAISLEGYIDSLRDYFSAKGRYALR
jgi:hypothetical protein